MHSNPHAAASRPDLTYDAVGGEKPSGVLLHAKFLDTLAAKAEEELARGQHYAQSPLIHRLSRNDGNAIPTCGAAVGKVHQLAPA